MTFWSTPVVWSGCILCGLNENACSPRSIGGRIQHCASHLALGVLDTILDGFWVRFLAGFLIRFLAGF